MDDAAQVADNRDTTTHHRKEPGVDTTFSTQEAAALLGRSYSWLDFRLRNGDFADTSGNAIQPTRTAGNYRRFDTETVKAICFAAYRRRWFSYDRLKEALTRLAVAEVQAKTGIS
jgi:hypothetical protein